MTQLHFRGRARVTGLLGALALATVACGDGRTEAASTLDTALSRDLTLAASATPGVAIGDTAVAAPVSPPVEPVAAPTPAPRPVPPVAPPTTRATASRAPSRAPVPATPRPAPTSAPAAPTPEPAVTPSAAPAPTPAPVGEGKGEAPSGRSRALGAGTVLSGTTNTSVCPSMWRPGDRLVVTLGETVTGPDGAALPAGTPLVIEVAALDTVLGFHTFRLRGVQLNGEFIPAEGRVRTEQGTVDERKISKGGSDQGKVITGAIIGGILGRVMGGGTRGAVIGAAGGAAAGTVAAARNRTTDRCLAAGATLSATLGAPLPLPPSP